MTQRRTGAACVAAISALVLVTFAFVALTPARASAHTLASSSVRLVVDDGGLHGTVALAVATLDRAFDAEHRSDALAADAYADQVVEYLDAHLSIDGRDGTPWTERYSNLVRQTTEGIETITVDVRVDPLGAEPANFAITYDAVIEAVPDHEAVLVLEGATGTVSTPGVFAAGHRTIVVGDGRGDAAMTDMVRFGFHHVLDGADHLLFLVTLLLPAAYCVEAGRWRRRPGVVRSGRKVLHVVTAFTLGHSLTLAATALGWIDLPSRPVEVLVAASVAVSAIHAVRPLIRGGEPALAAAFGLVHGMAFAGILHDLGLQGRTSAEALLAFNVGIELAQLLVVVLVLPSLYVLTQRDSWHIRSVGAAAALAVAVAWMLDRIGVVTSDPFGRIEAALIAHPWWVVGVLAGLAVVSAARPSLRWRRDGASASTLA